MRLRVISGEAHAQIPLTDQALITLHRTQGLLIQGTSDILTFSHEDGSRVFLGGEMVGHPEKCDEHADEGEIRISCARCIGMAEGSGNEDFS